MGEGQIYLGRSEIGHLESRGRSYRRIDLSRAPRIEGFEGQAPPEDRELIDVSGDGSEECLPPLVDGSRGDLLAPGVPLRNPLVLPSSSSSSSSVPPARSHPKGV